MINLASLSHRSRLAGGAAALFGTPLLLLLAQAPFDRGGLALVALVPWLVAGSRSSPPGAAALGFAVGTLYAGAAAPWIFEALRALGASKSSAAVGLFTTAAWTKGVPFLAIGTLAHAMRRRSSGASVLAVAALFFVVESLQSRFALGLPLGLLGHTQSTMPGVAQLAVVWLETALGAAASQGFRVEEARDTGPLRGGFSAVPVLCFEALFPALPASRRDIESRVIL